MSKGIISVCLKPKYFFWKKIRFFFSPIFPKKIFHVPISEPIASKALFFRHALLTYINMCQRMHNYCAWQYTISNAVFLECKNKKSTASKNAVFFGGNILPVIFAIMLRTSFDHRFFLNKQKYMKTYMH